MKHRALFVVAVLILVSGCAMQKPKPVEDAAAEIPFPEMPPKIQTDGAIYYQQGFGSLLFGDVRARHVGDIITVTLSEQTNATKEATTSTAKDNSVDVATPTLLGNALKFSTPFQGGQNSSLETGLSSSKSFDGSGSSAQSNQLTGSISAVVTEVLPNGYLRIRGKKVISINQGDEFIELTGVVRPVDVNPDNSISSRLVANARIAYTGEGAVSSANSMGWLAGFFNSDWWPF